MLAREAVVLPAMLGGVGVARGGVNSRPHGLLRGLRIVDAALPMRLVLRGLRIVELLPVR